MTEFVDAPVDVKQSAIHGEGVFATSILPRGLVIWDEKPTLFVTMTTPPSPQMVAEHPPEVIAAVWNGKEPVVPLDQAVAPYRRLTAEIVKTTDRDTWYVYAADAARMAHTHWERHRDVLFPESIEALENPFFADGQFMKDVYRVVVACAQMSFSLLTRRVVGMGLYLRGIHKVNHSCFPNCMLVALADGASVVALRDIQPGEELTISYQPLSCCFIRDRIAAALGWECNCGHCHKRRNFMDIVHVDAHVLFHRIQPQAEKAFLVGRYDLAHALFQKLLDASLCLDLLDQYFASCILSGKPPMSKTIQLCDTLVNDVVSDTAIPLDMLAMLALYRDFFKSMAVFETPQSPIWQALECLLPTPTECPFFDTCHMDILLAFHHSVRDVGGERMLRGDLLWTQFLRQLCIVANRPVELQHIRNHASQMMAAATRYHEIETFRETLEIPRCIKCKTGLAMVAIRPCLCLPLCNDCATIARPMPMCPQCGGPVEEEVDYGVPYHWHEIA